MISNSWSSSIGGQSLSQKITGKVKPDTPLKNKIDYAQKKLDFQITKLGTITEKLQKKHDTIFEKVVNAQRSHNNAYAQAYAAELVQVRKMRDMVGGAKLSMEQIQLRLNTVSELGDVVVTLSPCMSVIKGLSSQLSGIIPEANASMQDLSQVLGDVLSGSAMGGSDLMNTGISESADTLSILEEAHAVLEGQAKTTIPEIPSTFKEDVVNTKRSDILL